jgi:3-oxoacyl-[acyl-carrier-protein] synthase II
MREAAGLLAIREAAQTIERGHADLMIAGATGTRIHSFKTVHVLQHEQTANPELPPAEACRPFDADRTGMVVGEGAGAILLEELESARQRGATIYAEILSTGSSAVTADDAPHRRQTALTNAARSALTLSRLPADELGHIAAHGLSSTESDAEEAAALVAVLNSHAATVPVVAPKSNFGNLGAGSAVVETIASVLALHTGQLFPTLNYSTPDPRCPLNVVSAANPCPPGESFLKLTVTPQGQAAALVVRGFQ